MAQDPLLPVSGPPPEGWSPGLALGSLQHRMSGDLYLALPELACCYHTHRPGMHFSSPWNIPLPSPRLKASTSPFLTWPDLQPAGLGPCRAFHPAALSDLPQREEHRCQVHAKCMQWLTRLAHGDSTAEATGSYASGLPHASLPGPSASAGTRQQKAAWVLSGLHGVCFQKTVCHFSRFRQESINRPRTCQTLGFQALPL